MSTQPVPLVRQLSALVQIRRIVDDAVTAERAARVADATERVGCARCGTVYALRHETACRVEGEQHYYDETEVAAVVHEAEVAPVAFVRVDVEALYLALGI